VVLFDESVKERIEDFYDREQELEMFVKGVREGRRIIAVLGVRRLGKSSLVKVGLNVLGVPNIFIDVRKAYEEYGSISKMAVYTVFQEGLRKLISRSKWRSLIEKLKTLRGVKVAVLDVGVEVSLDWSSRGVRLVSILDRVDEWAGEMGERAVLVLDEAQYLRYSSINFRGLLAYVYDNLRNTVLVLTGSEVGLLLDFLRINDPASELYGRYIYEVRLGRFTREESVDFLRKGFAEYGINPPEDVVKEAVEAFDGIVGWLVKFGRLCVDRGVSRERIEETFVEASKLVEEELGKLFARSVRYRYILEAVANGQTRWSQIKKYVIVRELKPISDKVLFELLQNLQKMGLVEKRMNDEGKLEYYIPDPVIKYIVTK